jgi:hypothetical protein
MTTPPPSDKCRVCENPLDTHTGHDLDSCEKQAGEIARLREALEKETARRKFMQVYGRRMSWGIVGPLGLAGVQFTDESGRGLYQSYESFAYYADHDNDREAAEQAVIDAAMAALASSQENT